MGKEKADAADDDPDYKDFYLKKEENGNYVKHKWVADSDKLLNSAISLPELDVSDPDVPRLEPIHKSHKIWGLLLFIIGMICLLIPNNDTLGKYFYWWSRK